MLKSENIHITKQPILYEKNALPMHVYELQATIIRELYLYALNNQLSPPPIIVSTPIKYSPTDVYLANKVLVDSLSSYFIDHSGFTQINKVKSFNKTPTQVYQELFELYYKVNLLNGRTKVSPTEVYTQIFRAKEDLKLTLITLSKKSDNESLKRLLLTATYGMHPDGSNISEIESGKKPSDVLYIAFQVRENLNKLRLKNNLIKIQTPELSNYTNILPLDILLQTQFIIAELNLLKLPLNIINITNGPRPFKNKTPSDVYQEMKHINYMLTRLISTL